MNKEEYKKSLHRHYPEEPDNVLELAWHFHGMEKAKKYIKLLETCNHNADLAIKAIRAMYVSCDIDAVKAVSEKFITVLLPFTCMEKTAKPHSVTFHVRKMLDDCDVKAERKTEEARLRQACLTRQRANSPSRTADVTIQIRFQTDNEDLIRQIMQLASASNAVLVKVEESDLEIGGNYCESTQGWDDAQNISMSLNDYYNVSQVFDPPGTLNWFQLEGAAKDMLVTIANLRSIFGEEDPEVEYISIYKGIRSLSLSYAQRLAECEMSGW